MHQLYAFLRMSITIGNVLSRFLHNLGEKNPAELESRNLCWQSTSRSAFTEVGCPWTRQNVKEFTEAKVVLISSFPCDPYYCSIMISVGLRENWGLMRLNADYRLEGTIDLRKSHFCSTKCCLHMWVFSKVTLGRFSEVSPFHFLSLWQIKNQHIKVQF